MEDNQSEKQSSTRLSSRNKRVSYCRNGLFNLKNRITKVEPIVKKKMSARHHQPYKKKRFVEYVCCACKRSFQTPKEIKIHEQNGCTIGKRKATLPFHHSTSNNGEVEFVVVDGSEPRIKLTRLTSEMLKKYTDKTHPTQASSNYLEIQTPGTGILKNSENNSSDESNIPIKISAIETEEKISSCKINFVEESNANPIKPVKETVPRRSTRMATTVAQVHPEQIEKMNPVAISPICKPGINSQESNDDNSLQEENTPTKNAGNETREKNLVEETNIPPKNSISHVVTRRSSRTSTLGSEETEHLNPETLLKVSKPEILATESCDTNSSKFSRSKRLSKRGWKPAPVANKAVITPYACKACPSKFSCRKNLLSHLARHPELKKSRYRCSLCENTYHRKQSLNIHVLNQHTSLRPYSCSYCGNSFAIQPYLNTHLKRCSAQYSAGQILPKESKRFPGQKQSQRSTESSKIEMRCPLCHHVCNGQLALVNHMMRHRTVASLRNPQPDTEIAVQDPQPDTEIAVQDPQPDTEIAVQDPQPHTEIAVQDPEPDTEIAVQDPEPDTEIPQKYCCSICAKEFSTIERVEAHERKHKMATQSQPVRNDVSANDIESVDGKTNVYTSGPEPRRKRKSFQGIFKCSSCKYSTKYFGSLNKHELQVHNRVTVSKNTVSLPNFIHCQFCTYATKYKCNMSSHQRRIHGGESDRFSCKHCSFSTESVSDWKDHQLQAHNVRPISTCKKCNFVFASYYELKCHRMKHLRENTSCDSNLQPLAAEISSVEEMKVGTESETDCVVVDEGKLLHVCNLCGKKFARKSFLEKHVKCVHSENTMSLTSTNQKEKSPSHEITVPKSVEKKPTVKGDSHFKCKLCLVVCVSASALEKHLNRHRV